MTTCDDCGVRIRTDYRSPRSTSHDVDAALCHTHAQEARGE